jgi:hypothetical protein
MMITVLLRESSSRIGFGIPLRLLYIRLPALVAECLALKDPSPAKLALPKRHESVDDLENGFSSRTIFREIS